MRAPLLAAALAASVVGAQSSGYTARLTPAQAVVVSGERLDLTLRIECQAQIEVDAGVLDRHRLEVRSEGGESVVVGELAGSPITVASGTRIERRFGLVLPVTTTEGLRRVTIAWPGLDGAVTSVQVAPEQRGIDVDALDLAATKVLLLTSFGPIELSLRPDMAPNHVRNFVALARAGFYDGTKFHRVVRDKIVQGGCPNTRDGATGRPGTGSPGHTVAAEFNALQHVRGALSMARGAEEDSAGSQFFMCHGDMTVLDGRYTVFGRIDSGLEVLDAIAAVPVQVIAGTPTPVEPVHLHRALVLPATPKQTDKGSK